MYMKNFRSTQEEIYIRTRRGHREENKLVCFICPHI